MSSVAVGRGLCAASGRGACVAREVVGVRPRGGAGVGPQPRSRPLALPSSAPLYSVALLGPPRQQWGRASPAVMVLGGRGRGTRSAWVCV